MIRSTLLIGETFLKPSRTIYKQQQPFTSSCCFWSRFKFRLKNNPVQKLKMPGLGDAPQRKISVAASMLKPTLFTITFTSTSFVAAALWQYENMRKRARDIFNDPNKWFSKRISPKRGKWRKMFSKYWNALAESDRVFLSILLCNILVCAGWKIPAFQGFMEKYFVVNSVLKKVYIPLIFAAFSHSSVLHLCINMYVLRSFMPAIVDNLGKEQFIAFYLSAAAVSSYFSLFFRKVFSTPSVSLGASGAIFAVVSYVCFKFPDIKLSVIFIPNWTFNAGTGILAMMAFDTICLLSRFKFLDHACHLGGMGFGAFWCLYGVPFLWMKRGPLLEWWHKIRNPRS